MPSYASPTNTFLDKLDETKRSNSFGNGSHKLPAVFEIFTLNNEGDKKTNDKSTTKGRFKFTSANDISSLAKKPQDKNQQKQSQSQSQTNPNTVAINMGFEGDDHTQTIYKLWVI